MGTFTKCIIPYLTVQLLTVFSINPHLFISQYDLKADTWTQPQDITQQSLYSDAAASIAHNGTHFGIAYVQQFSTSIFVQFASNYNGKWTNPSIILYSVAKSEASITYYNNMWIIGYYDKTHTLWTVNSTDGSIWNKPINMTKLINNGVSVSSTPYLSQYPYNNDLFMFITAYDSAYNLPNQAFIKYDGNKWSNVHYLLGSLCDGGVYQSSAIYTDYVTKTENTLFIGFIGRACVTMNIQVYDGYGIIDELKVPPQTSASFSLNVYD
eukprot:183155_1